MLHDLWSFQAQQEYAPETLVLQLSSGNATFVHINTVSVHMAKPTMSVGLLGQFYQGTVSKLLFDLPAVKDMFKHSIQNTFRNFGETILKQTIGNPMGANHCVYLANFDSLQYERMFFKTVIAAVCGPVSERSQSAAHLLATFK